MGEVALLPLLFFWFHFLEVCLMARSRRSSKKKANTAAWYQTAIVRDILGLASLCAALFTALAPLSLWLYHGIGSFAPVLRSARPSANLMGPAGHFYATLTDGFGGLGALIIPAVFAYLAFQLWDDQEEPTPRKGAPLPSRLLAIAVLFAGLATAAQLWMHGGGGELGSLVGESLRSYFGPIGAWLFALTLIALALRIFTGCSIVEIGALCANGFVKALLVTAQLLVGTLRFLRNALSSLGRLRQNSGGVRAVVSQHEEPQLSTLPRPKNEPRRKTEQPVVVRKVNAAPVKSKRGGLLGRGKRNAEPSGVTAEEYIPPSLELLETPENSVSTESEKDLVQRSQVIVQKLEDFGVAGTVTKVHPGPVVTMYEFEPAPGIKLSKIVSLQDDLGMSLRAPSVRVIAPIPGKGTVGIEVPNRDRELVSLRELLEYDQLADTKSRMAVPLGKDIYGNPVIVDIADMPHLLMAGATGTGKSVSINAILLSLLFRASPEELQFVLIDPKILELSVYDDIPHLKVPVVTDSRKAKAVLQWAVGEMDSRYRLLRKYGVRSIDAYNNMVAGETSSKKPKREQPESIVVEELKPLPKVLIVIDELADLMLTAGREVEDLITRLAQKARAAGIHLLLATQRPSVDVITGLIKANFPARVSFRVSSRVDSRTILDRMGSESLLGKGDMLFLGPGTHYLKRVHGAFVSDSEVREVIEELKNAYPPQYDEEVVEACEKALEDEGSALSGTESAELDPLFDEVVNFVLKKGQASTSMIQRAFRIGYNRAARIMDSLEEEGVVGPMDGAKPRDVIPQPLDGEVA